MSNKMSKAQKVREGALLASAYNQKKSAEPTITQESIMDELGKTQGLMGQWISGLTSIPDRHLIWLGARLGFDPLDIRPDLEGRYSIGAESIKDPAIKELVAILGPCPKHLRGAAVEMVRSLVRAATDKGQ